MSETPLPGTGGRPLARVVDGILFDLDGVVYRGEHAVAHAPEAINALEVPYGFVTNNASRSPGDVAAHLRDLGIHAETEQVTTSAQAAAALITREYGTGTKVLMVGGEGLRTALEQESLAIVDSAEDAPEVVVQGTSQTITWAELAEAVYAINNGADHVATNLDSTMPTERGMALGNGALVAAVAHATGVRPTYAAGKPEPQIFTHAAQRAGMAGPLVVGDRLDTDIKGAARAGIPGLVVLTGVCTVRDLLTAREGERPRYIARDLRGLHEAHPPVAGDHAGWRCGEARARVEDGELWVGTRAVSGTGATVEISLDELRAACAAAWAAPEPLALDREVHIH